jgi:hypothetical protein
MELGNNRSLSMSLSDQLCLELIENKGEFPHNLGVVIIRYVTSGSKGSISPEIKVLDFQWNLAVFCF